MSEKSGIENTLLEILNRITNLTKHKYTFFTIGEMIVPGSSYWNMGFGREKGEVNDDAEGLGVMKTLGENMAWLLKKIAV